MACKTETYRISNNTFQNMNLASFYLGLLMNIKRFNKTTLKRDIVGKEDNYIKISSHIVYASL